MLLPIGPGESVAVYKVTLNPEPANSASRQKNSFSLDGLSSGKLPVYVWF
jgi:hypothetical protein